MTVHDTFSGSPGALRWPTLFSPLRIGRRTVLNRFVSTPHATGWGHDGLLTRREVDYHVRKAAGGVGLVMTFGSAAVDPNSAASYGSISLWDQRNDDLLRELAERVHEHGALIMSQMTHMGRRRNSLLSGIPLKAASDLPEGVHREVPAVFTEDELTVLVGRFGQAARRLMDLGWDGAEVTSLGGHLIEQFFDPNVNTRTDRHGADDAAAHAARAAGLPDLRRRRAGRRGHRRRTARRGHVRLHGSGSGSGTGTKVQPMGSVAAALASPSWPDRSCWPPRRTRWPVSSSARCCAPTRW